MTTWIQRFRNSVSWGGDITAALLPDGTPCCFMTLDDGQDGQHVWVSGFLGDIPAAIAKAQQAAQASDCKTVTVLFLDQQATAAQVEEALHLVAYGGAGCDFLEVQPRVLCDGLLLRMSEGTILDGPPPPIP